MNDKEFNDDDLFHRMRAMLERDEESSIHNNHGKQWSFAVPCCWERKESQHLTSSRIGKVGKCGAATDEDPFVNVQGFIINMIAISFQMDTVAVHAQKDVMRPAEEREGCSMHVIEIEDMKLDATVEMGALGGAIAKNSIVNSVEPEYFRMYGGVQFSVAARQ